MSRGDFCCVATLVLILCVGVFMGGFASGEMAMRTAFEKELIDRGHTQHNRITGEWEWIEPGASEGE